MLGEDPMWQRRWVFLQALGPLSQQLAQGHGFRPEEEGSDADPVFRDDRRPRQQSDDVVVMLQLRQYFEFILDGIHFVGVVKVGCLEHSVRLGAVVAANGHVVHLHISSNVMSADACVEARCMR